ncbi:hypothetical protein Bxe_A2675 [Paraburkholderia xenovorans LB400]|uniref:Uncharacterized protein n=1 Tax=Paraburkholderia xenovorans (strain LB400) TaxID=266265 RepID=Q140F3_PARXL|nr:hypothetical protein Bxe_A2675 [Paraburkholderia xenovorans LB400]
MIDMSAALTTKANSSLLAFVVARTWSDMSLNAPDVYGPNVSDPDFAGDDSTGHVTGKHIVVCGPVGAWAGGWPPSAYWSKTPPIQVVDLPGRYQFTTSSNL